MSLELPREPEPGDPIAARDIAALIRYVRSITPRGGPGIRVSTLASGTTISAAPKKIVSEQRRMSDPSISFWPRLVTENGVTRLHVRGGTVSIAGGPAVEIKPQSGEEFVFDLPQSGYTDIVLLWQKPGAETPPGFPTPAYDAWAIWQTQIGLVTAYLLESYVWFLICRVDIHSQDGPSITFCSPGDKLGIDINPSDSVIGNDVVVYDRYAKCYTLAHHLGASASDPEYAVQRLQRVSQDNVSGNWRYRWVNEPTGEIGQILYWSGDGWFPLPRPSAPSLLYCSGEPDYQLSWVPAEDYRNPS